MNFCVGSLCLFNFHIVDDDNLNLSTYISGVVFCIAATIYIRTSHELDIISSGYIILNVSIFMNMIGRMNVCVRWQEQCAMMWMMRVVCAPLTFHHPSSNRLIVIKQQLTEILFQVFEVHIIH